MILFLLLFNSIAFAQDQSSPVDAILTEDMIKGLRDPFRLPTILELRREAAKSDLEAFSIKDLKMNGVITGTKKPKAMITLPNSKTFFVSVGDRVGIREGRVVSIAGDSIKVVEYEMDMEGKRTPEMFLLSISGEITQLNKKEEL